MKAPNRGNPGSGNNPDKNSSFLPSWMTSKLTLLGGGLLALVTGAYFVAPDTFSAVTSDLGVTKPRPKTSAMVTLGPLLAAAGITATAAVGYYCKSRKSEPKSALSKARDTVVNLTTPEKSSQREVKTTQSSSSIAVVVFVIVLLAALVLFLYSN